MTDPSSSWWWVGSGKRALGEEWSSEGSVLWASGTQPGNVEDSAGKEGRQS